MRWEDERYVRWYTRNVPEWSVLRWQARGLFGLILREVDRAGILPLGKLGIKAVAVQVQAPWDEIEVHLKALLDDGMIVYLDEARALLIPNFVAAQEAVATDKARQRAARERARDAMSAKSLGVTPPSRSVTGESRTVTECHADPRAGHSEPSRTDLSRAEPVTDATSEPVPKTPHPPPPPGTGEAYAISSRIRSHAELADLDAVRIAEHQLGWMMNRGTKLAWVLEAIDECAAKTPPGLTAEARQAKLVGFMRHAKPPRIDANGKAPATSVAQSAEISPERAEVLRKAQAEKRAKAEAARAHAEAQANGGKHA